MSGTMFYSGIPGADGWLWVNASGQLYYFLDGQKTGTPIFSGSTIYTAGTGISIANNTISIDSNTVALKIDIPTINPNTTILGNSVNVANGLVQLGTDGKIPTTLYDAATKNKKISILAADITAGVWSKTKAQLTCGDWPLVQLFSPAGLLKNDDPLISIAWLNGTLTIDFSTTTMTDGWLVILGG